MQIAILGPLTVLDDAGAPVDIAGARLRTLLTRLAVDTGRPVGVATLVDTVWGDDPPAAASNALQTLVSRLRRTLGAASVEQSPAGYRLAAAPEQIDSRRFRRLAADGKAALRRGAADDALELLDDALALWRGPALADTRDQAEALAVVATELDDQWLTTCLDRGEARLALGAVDADGITELERLVAAHPLHERLTAILVRSLAAAGRQPDALNAYEALRSRLADELGVDPSPDLRELHLTLLRDGDDTAPRRTNLKAQLTSFVGRDDEVARIGKSLEANRLVTLVGPGGAGKTRLASEAASRCVDDVPDGVWLVELAAVTSGADVAHAVLASAAARESHVIGRRPGAPRDAMSQLRDAFADRAAVIILDNCEHVIEATARLAEQLLGECPDLRVLATSREPLGILGETLLVVPPLGMPAATADAVDAMGYPAVRLFVDRAVSVSPDFVLRDADVAAVVEIVSRLDGLPLAIELAAARLRTMPLDDIAERLGDRFRLLTGGSRTALPRHRTLRAVVDWSWGLLTDTERAVAERLAVFPAGITAASAGAVCSDLVDTDDISDVLASLIDKSLLQPLDGGRRSRMLETIREYGIERLGERGELTYARHRHADHFAALLAEAEPHLTTSGQLPWFALLRAERGNIVAALRYRSDVGDADGALQITATLGVSSMMLGDHADITTWTAEALAVAGAKDRSLELMVRGMHAMNSFAVGNSGDLVDLPALVDELRDVSFPGGTLMSLLRPAMAFFSGETELGETWARENIEQGNEWTRAATQMFVANFAENSGDLVTMRSATDAALVAFRKLGERWGLASTLRNYAQILTYDEDLLGAAAAYEEALSLMREMESTEDEVFLYQRLTDLALRRGDLDRAREYNDLARSAATSGHSPVDSALALAMRADIEWRLGDRDQARELARHALDRIGDLPEGHPALGHAHAWVLALAARIVHGSGDPVAAAADTAHAFEAARRTKDQQIIAVVGVLVAELVAADDASAAARLLGVSAGLRGTPDWSAQEIATLRQRLWLELGDDTAQARYDEGRALPVAAALALIEHGVESVQERLR